MSFVSCSKLASVQAELQEQIDEKIGGLVDCNGLDIDNGAAVATCANLTQSVPNGGTDGQVLTKQADGTNAWEALPVATTSGAGVVELATPTEALAGTSTTLAVTPVGLAAALDEVGNITAGTNVTLAGTGSAASPFQINVPSAADTVAGAVQLATAANYPSPANDTDATTPAYVAAAVAAAAVPLTNCAGAALSAGSSVLACSEVTDAVKANETVTSLSLSGNNYIFTNEAGTQATIEPGQLLSSDTGNALGLGSDGRITVAIPAQLADDQQLTGDNSGTVGLLLTPVDDGAGNINYTIKADVKLATTTPTNETNLLVYGASGFYVSADEAAAAIAADASAASAIAGILSDCDGAPLTADSQVATCVNLTASLTTKQDQITGGLEGQVYTVQADGSYAWETPAAAAGETLSLVDCGGAAITSGAAVATCANLSAGLATKQDALPAGTDGQVLTKQADGSVAFETPASGGGTGYGGVVPGTAVGVSSRPANGTWVTPVAVLPTLWQYRLTPSGPDFTVIFIDGKSDSFMRGSDGVWYTTSSVDGRNAFRVPAGVTPTQITGLLSIQ